MYCMLSVGLNLPTRAVVSAGLGWTGRSGRGRRLRDHPIRVGGPVRCRPAMLLQPVTGCTARNATSAEPSRDGTVRGGTGRYGMGRDGTGRNWTGRDGTGQDGTSRAEPSRAEPNRTEPSRAEPSRAEARQGQRWLNLAFFSVLRCARFQWLTSEPGSLGGGRPGRLTEARPVDWLRRDGW